MDFETTLTKILQDKRADKIPILFIVQIIIILEEIGAIKDE